MLKLEGTSQIQDWIASSAQPYLAEIKQKFINRLRDQIDDDEVEDESLPLLLDGQMKITSYGDDESDLLIAKVCEDFRNARDALLRGSLLLVAPTSEDMNTLHEGLRALYPDLEKYWTTFVSTDMSRVEEQILSKLQSRELGNFHVITAYNPHLSYQSGLTMLLDHIKDRRLHVLFAQLNGNNIYRLHVLRYGPSVHPATQVQDTEDDTPSRTVIESIKAFGTTLRLDGDKFDDLKNLLTTKQFVPAAVQQAKRMLSSGASLFLK